MDLTQDDSQRPADAASTAGGAGGAGATLVRRVHRIAVGARRFLHEVVQITVPALFLAIVIHLFLAQATVVYGKSMEPSLSPQQRLIVDKVSYRLHAPQRFDIVVVDLPTLDEMLVKRVVGLPGETIELRGGTVLVDGMPLAEGFLQDLGGATLAPQRLGPHEYFVMGDNRDNSSDSRHFGPVQRDWMVGRIWLRIWPLQRVTLF